MLWAAALLLALASNAAAATAPPLPPAPPVIPSPYIVVDIGAGTVLAERSADAVRYPASLTKLMTAYLAFEALAAGRLKLTSPVVESATALAEPPSKMGFAVGTVYTVDNALKMLIVKSANDVAVALGEAIAGSKPAFVVAMNDAARRLGMSQSHFENPNGLHDEGHVTTARDMAVLAARIWKDFPQYRDLFGIPAIRSGKQVLRSENPLLERYEGADGMKTGYTCAAGFNLVATATRGDRTLLVVVMAESSSRARAQLAVNLLDQGFNTGTQVRATSLKDFRSPSGFSGPVDLHDMVCKRHAPIEGAPGPGDPWPLGPPLRTAEPVKVFTGGADGESGRDPAPVKAAVAAGIPSKKDAGGAVAPPAKAVAAATSAGGGAPVPRPKPAPPTPAAGGARGATPDASKSGPKD